MSSQLNQLLSLWSLYQSYKARNRKSSRRWYVRPVNRRMTRFGEQHSILKDMRAMDSESYFKYFRMTPRIFDHLLDLIKPFLKHKLTHTFPISPAERLAITLRILATGDSPQTVALSYRIGHSTIYSIFYETCAALWKALQPTYLPTPTLEKWLAISHGFWTHSNFPLCLGAINSKRVVIRTPPKSGSKCSKGSIVLMTVADHEFKFTLVDIGSYGSDSDGGVFSKSGMKVAIENGSLNLPLLGALPTTEIEIPYMFVADEEFPLKTWLMRPFPGKDLNHDKRVFNYRLSRARRCGENAFGLLGAHWRIFQRPIEATPEHATLIVKAAIVLHNYLLSWEPHLKRETEGCGAERREGSEGAGYAPPELLDREVDGIEIPGQWRTEVEADTGLTRVGSVGSNMYAATARDQRDIVMNYFCSPAGSVHSQDIKPDLIQ